MLRHVDLCSGIGGFSLGFEWAELSSPILLCDSDPFCRKVLAKHWPNVPIANDVKELSLDPIRLVPDCDILSCGYPCQPFSQAGNRRGKEDDRHLWPEIFKIIQAKRPRWVVCENVFGHISMGLDEVLSDMEAQNYSCQSFVVPACAVNAPHRRDRVWIIAHTNSQGEPDVTRFTEEGQRMVVNTQNDRRDRWATETRRSRSESESDKSQSSIRSQSSGSGQDVADTDSTRCQEQWWGQPAQSQHEATKCGDWWSVEPPVGRVANGIPRRVDKFDGWEREPADIPRVAKGVKDRVKRLKGLGNAVVPSIAMQIGLTIKAVEHGDS